MDVVAFRDKKTVRVVTTKGGTVKADEFPMFYLAEVDPTCSRETVERIFNEFLDLRGTGVVSSADYATVIMGLGAELEEDLELFQGRRLLASSRAGSRRGAVVAGGVQVEL